MPRSFVIPVLLLGLLSGCASLAPEYQRPEAPVPASYPGGQAGAVAGIRAVDIGWREFFQDPRLQALIETALEHNRDLRSAVLNIEAARAAYNIQSAERLPSLDAQGSFSRGRTPATLSPTGQDRTTSQYQVGLGIAAFELDFFGRVSSLSEAALAEFLATEEAARAAQISLVAEVGRAYLAERAFAEQLELARQTLAAREDSLRLVRQRFEAGAASALELWQAETLVESARVSVAALERQQAQAGNALALLVGAPLAQLELPAPLPLSQLSVLTDIPPG